MVMGSGRVTSLPWPPKPPSRSSPSIDISPRWGGGTRPDANQSLIPPCTESREVCGEYTEIPAAAHRKRLDWRGLERVKEERGLKIVGWYDTMNEVGELMASSATAGVKLMGYTWFVYQVPGTIRNMGRLDTHSIVRRIRIAFGRETGASYHQWKKWFSGTVSEVTSAILNSWPSKRPTCTSRTEFVSNFGITSRQYSRYPIFLQAWEELSSLVSYKCSSQLLETWSQWESDPKDRVIPTGSSLVGTNTWGEIVRGLLTWSRMSRGRAILTRSGWRRIVLPNLTPAQSYYRLRGGQETYRFAQV